MFKKHLQHLSNRTKKPQQITAALVVLLVAGTGTYLLLGSHAASPYASITADNVTPTNGASKQTCNGASDGSCVVFGSTSASGATISPTPDGVPAPSGGWSVTYGDAFNDPLCTPNSSGACTTESGVDNTLYPNRDTGGGCSNDAGFNTDEMEAFNCSAVSENPATGLTLSCSYTGQNTVMETGDDPANYTCGTVNAAGSASGYKFFTWKPGEGQEWAVEINTKFPPNTGEADPGWWAHGGNYQEELDFFESFGAGAGKDGTWTTPEPPSNGYIGTTDPTWIDDEGTSSQTSTYGENYLSRDDGFDVSAGYHTYTTVFFPDGSFSEYIDGKIQTWSWYPTASADCPAFSTTCTVGGPPPVNNNQALSLILSYGLRDDTDGDPDPYFMSGTRDFDIRSIAVYENASADGANTANGGLAPGTTLNSQ